MGQDESTLMNSNREYPTIRVNCDDPKYYCHNDSLENTKDLDMYLEEISQGSFEEPSEWSDDSEVMVIRKNSSQKQILQEMIGEESNKFINRLSNEYRNLEGFSLSRYRMSTMLEIVGYCQDDTKLLLSSVNRYFKALIRSSLTSVEVVCNPGWVDAVNRSPFIRELTLRKNGSESDMNRFCRILKNDGFSELRNLSVNYMDDETTCKVLSAWSTNLSRAMHIGILPESFQPSLSLGMYDVSSYFSYVFAEQAERSFYHILTEFVLLTSDLEGIEGFLRIVDFSEFRNLQVIRFSECPLKKRGFEILVRSLWPESKHVSELPPIRELYLDDTKITDVAMESLGIVMQRGALHNLEVLDISSNNVSYQGFSLLTIAFAQFTCPNLHTLRLDNNAISAGYMVPFFNQMCNGICPVLECISLSNTGISSSDMIAFSNYLSSEFSTNLSSITISNNPLITSSLPSFFHSLYSSPCTSMKSLFVEGVSLTSSDLRLFLDWVKTSKASHLQEVSFKSNLIDEEGLRLLLQSSISTSCPGLHNIDLSGNYIGDFNEKEWIQLLAESHRSLHLNALNFSFNPISNNDIRLLMMYMNEFNAWSSLRSISFCNNPITAEALSFIMYSLEEVNHCITSMSFESCNLQNAGKCIKDFLSSPASCNLRYLSFRDCNLSSIDLLMILDGLNAGFCNKLLWLVLDGNDGLNDDFISMLIKLLEKHRVPALSRLEAQYTSITIQGVECLLDYVESHSMQRLNTIDLTKIHITKKEKALLRERAKQAYAGRMCF